MQNEVFRSRLVDLRKSRGVRQVDMAALLNLERTTYGCYERGTIMPPYDKIEAIAKYHGVSVAFLMGDTNNPEPILRRDADDVLDVYSALESMLRRIKNEGTEVVVEGRVLDSASRELMVSSLESSLKMGRMLSDLNKKED